MNADNGLVILDALATLVPMGIALAIPFLVEFFSKPTTNVYLRTVANAALSTLAAAVSTVVFTGGWADIDDYLMNILLAWIVTGRTYITQLPIAMHASKHGEHRAP